MAELEDAPWAKKAELEDAPWHKGEQPSRLEDVAKTAAPSTAKGVIGLAGLGGDLQGLLSGIMGSPDQINNYLQAKSKEYFPNAFAKLKEQSAPYQNMATGGDLPINVKLPSSHDIQSKVEEYTGPFYKPKTDVGRVADVGLQVAPSLLLGGETALGTALKSAGAGAGSEGAGEAAKGLKGYLPESIQPYAEPVARSIGAVGGSFIPAGARRAVTPLPAADEQFAATQRLRQSNPELVEQSTAGQLTDTPGLRALEGRSHQNAPAQEQAFTEGVGRTVGAPAGSTFPEIVQHGDTIGTDLRNLRNANPINTTELRSLSQDARMARAAFAHQHGADAATALDEAVDSLRQGRAGPTGPILPGERYGMLLQNLQTSIENAPNSQTMMALSNLRDRLKTAFQNSAPAGVGEQEQQLARQYANNSALSGISPKTGRETVTPQEVLSAASKQQGARRTNANQGELAPLAQDASRVMTELPNNPNPNGGPLSRLMGAAVGGILGGGAGHATGGGMGALSEGIVGAILGGERGHDVAEVMKNLLSRGVNTPAAQAYLRNQQWRPGPHTSSDADQIARMLLAPPVNRLGEQ